MSLVFCHISLSSSLFLFYNQSTGVPSIICFLFLLSELDQFRSGGKEPETETTFCFGEELLETDDVSKKLIIIKVNFGK